MSQYISDGLWLGNVAVVNIKDIHYRCVILNMTKNDVINSLNNSELDDKGSLWI